MSETKTEDVLVPLLKFLDFKHFTKFDEVRKKAEPLYLSDFGFSINFIHIVTTDEVDKIIAHLESKSTQFDVKKVESDSVDKQLFEKGAKFYFNRIIFKKKNHEILRGVIDKNKKEVICRLFINIAKMQYKRGDENAKTLPNHIVSVVLTSYNHEFKDWVECEDKNDKIENEYYNLSNEQIIELANSNFSSLLGGYNFSEEAKKDAFVAIQLWRHDWKSEQDNTCDAKKYVQNNPYYFYSILTLEKNVFRRTYDNVTDVLGWCQSASGVYFDVFSGTTCLELTIKPKKDVDEEYQGKYFDEIGHDSEEFRIWEILALQKHIVRDKDLNSKTFKDLNVFFDFQEFTKKLEKGVSWISYARYLQKITGIQYHYDLRRREFELEEREREKKLQKLNFLIIASIFISFVTFFLTPVYERSLSSIPPTQYIASEIILKNSYPELFTVIVALIFTVFFYLWAGIMSEKPFRSWINRLKSKHLIFDLILVLVLFISIIIYIYYYLYIFSIL